MNWCVLAVVVIVANMGMVFWLVRLLHKLISSADHDPPATTRR